MQAGSVKKGVSGRGMGNAEVRCRETGVGGGKGKLSQWIPAPGSTAV